MNRGLKPRRRRLIKRCFHKRFGSTTDIPDFNLLEEMVPIPDQNAPDPYFSDPPLPNGCTGFSVSYIASLDLKQYCEPRFTYDKTLLVQGGQEGDECTLHDAFISSTVYGVRLRGETDTQALVHRRSPPLDVTKTPGCDWFDSILSAAFTNKRPVALGTTWLQAWENVDHTGIMTTIPTVWFGGHAWLVVGKKTINGIEYAIGLTWNGPIWGNNGLAYFPREVLNATMDIPGSDALTNRPYQNGDTYAVVIILYQTILSFLRKQLKIASGAVAGALGLSYAH